MTEQTPEQAPEQAPEQTPGATPEAAPAASRARRTTAPAAATAPAASAATTATAAATDLPPSSAEGRQVPVTAPDGTADGTASLPAEVFDVTTNVPLIHQVVVAQLAAARQGTHATKTRGQVSGGGKKPYKQKGTGRARQGSIRAPQFTGGGTVHGPQPRDYSQRTPKKMKAAALRGALSDRARHDRVHVVSGVVAGAAPSTKAAVATVARLAERQNFLVVLERGDALAWKSLRNADGVHVIAADQLNTYDVLCADDVVFTRGALEAFVAGPARRRSSEEAPR